ncbi:MAG: EI24 domain-containing protein [Paracoccaceae bacterium]
MALGVILGSLFRALGQLGDRRFRRVLGRGVGLTLLLLAALTALVAWGVGWLVGDSVTLPLVGQVQWVDSLASVAFLVLMLVLSVFLMVPVASAFVSMFLDDVAQAVEDRHYPALPPVTPLPVTDAVRDALVFFGVIVAANLAALVLTLVLPIAGLPVFYAVNGYLLGREYFTLAAMRRVGRAEAARLRARHGGTIWLAGVLMALPLSVPVMNLVVPILGAAVFTHLFHSLHRRPSG